MATTLNVRFRSDVLEWAERISAETGLPVARVIELATLYARDAGWHPISSPAGRYGH